MSSVAHRFRFLIRGPKDDLRPGGKKSIWKPEDGGMQAQRKFEKLDIIGKRRNKVKNTFRTRALLSLGSFALLLAASTPAQSPARVTSVDQRLRSAKR